MSAGIGGLIVPLLGEVPPGERTRDGIGALGDLLGGESQDSRRFLRGLVLGSLVGAAIAGSSIWSRRQRARAARDPGRRGDAAPKG